MIRPLLYTLAALCAVCACALFVCPEDSLKRYVRFSCALCVICAIVSFLPRADGALPEPDTGAAAVEDMTDEVRKMIAEQTVSRMCGAAREYVSDRFGIPEENIEAQIPTENGEDGIKITAVKISLYGIRYAYRTVDIKKAVSELFGVGCEVSVIE